MEARRISAIIKYNNKDISVDISKYLKSISYTDNLSGEADDLQIKLEDRDGLWQSTWMPEKGALLDVTLQQKYWQNLSALPQSLRLGLFEIDEITSSGYPSEVQIKAVSVPDNNTLRGTERSRSWEKAKLQVIANDIASAAGMSLFWDTEENPVLDRAEQTEQSDLSFLYAICKDKGLALKISDKKIIVFDEAKYEAEKAKITIVKPGTVYKKESGMKYLFVGTGYSLRTKIRDIYAACRVNYQQGSSKSNIRDVATIIPAGTRGTAGDNVFFAINHDVSILAGTIEAEAAASCTVAGTVGNGYLPGEINKIVDPIPYVAKMVNITTSEGGADIETDDSLREAIREAPEGFSVAGPVGEYIRIAKRASTLIVDVSVTTPKPGQVLIVPLLNEGGIPGEEMLKIVETACNERSVRPLTDQVIVKAPDIVKFNVEVTYYINRADEAQSISIQSGVAKAVNDYVIWQKSKLGRDINPDELISLIKKAGAKRVFIASPNFQVIEENNIAIAENVSVILGGMEDE